MKTMMTSIAMMTLTFTMSTMVFAQPEGKGNRAKTETHGDNAKAQKPPQPNRKDFDRGYISPYAVNSYTGTTTINAGTLNTIARDNGNNRDKTASAAYDLKYGANNAPLRKTKPGTVQARLEGDPNHPVVVGSATNAARENFVAGANGGVWQANDVREIPAKSIAVDPSDPTGSTASQSGKNIIGVLIAR